MHDENHDDLSPRERRHLRTHQAILDAARAIIQEEGTEGLSMRAIADRIDYSPASLYEYFGGKDEIIGAVCTQGHRRLKAYLEVVDSQMPPQEYLVELGVAYIRFALQNPDYFLLMFTATASDPIKQDAASPPEESSFPILLQGVQRGLNAELLLSRHGFGQREIAYALWALVHGIAMLRITSLRTYTLDFDAIDRQALQSFVRGLSR